MHPADIEIRAEICARCATPCDQRADASFRADPCSECPISPPGWGRYGGSGCAQHRTFGLGDLVATVAQPIARAIDAVAGTNIKGCGGCKKRQEALNRLVPRI